MNDLSIYMYKYMYIPGKDQRTVECMYRKNDNNNTYANGLRVVVKISCNKYRYPEFKIH